MSHFVPGTQVWVGARRGQGRDVDVMVLHAAQTVEVVACLLLGGSALVEADTALATVGPARALPTVRRAVCLALGVVGFALAGLIVGWWPDGVTVVPYLAVNVAARPWLLRPDRRR